MKFEELNEIAKYDEFYNEKKMGMISLQIPPDLANGDCICVDRQGKRQESVRPIKVHRLYLGTRKDLDMYGIMVGIAEYNGFFYRFHYHVCNKELRGVYKMKFVKGIVVKRKDGVPDITSVAMTPGLTGIIQTYRSMRASGKNRSGKRNRTPYFSKSISTDPSGCYF